MSQIWNFKFSTSYLKKETVEINFNNLTQYIQNAIISTYNHYKTFNEIFSSHFSIVFKTVCVLHDDSPRLVTFQVLNSHVASGYHIIQNIRGRFSRDVKWRDFSVVLFWQLLQPLKASFLFLGFWGFCWLISGELADLPMNRGCLALGSFLVLTSNLHSSIILSTF